MTEPLPTPTPQPSRGGGAATYTINPLDWKIDKSGDWQADTIFGALRVHDNNRWDDEGPDKTVDLRFSYCVDEYYDEGSEPVASIDAGMARAWDWYLSRLMPALTPSAQRGDGDAAMELVRKMAEYPDNSATIPLLWEATGWINQARRIVRGAGDEEGGQQ